MKRAMVIPGLVMLIFGVAGCGASQKPRAAAPPTFAGRSILYAGQSVGGLPRRVVSDAEATHDVNLQLRSWVALLAKYRGGGLPVALTPHQFRQRLAAAAARYNFSVKHLQFFRARALAPLVIVETRHYLALARAIRAFYKSLDPQVGAHAGPPCTRSWGKTTLCAPPELMFFEAQDERGVPFIALGMGQWARSEELYPGPHG